MRCAKRIIGTAALLVAVVFSTVHAQEKDGANELPEMAAKAVAALFADPSQCARITNGEADRVVAALPDAFPGVKKYDLLQRVYQELKPEVKQQPEHAVKARVLAALARASRQRTTDVAEAEQLDLVLNPEQPDAWLRRGISYARMKEEKYAADMFLEALRRTDFARPPEFFTALAPPTAGWVARIARAKRTDELNSALADSFSKTKSGTAKSMAFAMLQAVLDVDDTPLQPQRLALLLKSVREHQQHLLVSHVAQLLKRIDDWDQAGHHEASTALARAILLTPMGDVMQVEIPAHQEIAAPFAATAFWGDKSWTVDVRGMIPSLIKTALREPHGDFFQEAEAAVGRHQDDCHLVSCILLARSMVSSLNPEALAGAKGLDAVSRLRVAWRLRVLSPPGSVDEQLLAPWIAEGIPALLKLQEGGVSRGSNLRQSLHLLPVLDETTKATLLPTLLPLLREKLVKQNLSGDSQLSADLWPQFLVLAMVHGNAEEREACLKAWRESVHRRRLDIGQEWMECRRMARSVVDAMVTASPERGRDLARLAFESWSAAWTRSLKEGDADELTAVVVLDCLLSANLTDELATFEKQMLNTFSEYGSVQFRTTLGRLRACRDCLGRGEQKFPAVAIEVLDAAPEGGPPRVRWAMEIPTELSDKARIQTMVVDGEKAGAPYKAPALHALSGKYDLEIHVGASPDAMRKIAGAEAVPAQGEMTIQDLPASGWVRVLVKNPRNGLIAIGPANPYCITRAELHSKRVPQGPVPVWPHEVRDEFGTPLSEVTPVEKGMEYLLRVDLEESDSLPIWSGRLPQGLNLVVMDEKQKPIAKMAGFDTRGVSDDLQPSMRLLRPGGWAVEFGDIFEPDGSILRPDVSRAHYLVFTASGALDAGAPAVRLQKFRRYEEEVMPRILPEADVEFMGNLGMEAVTWFISNARPRAVMGGQGGIRVYDTSKVPWELIRSFESPVLKGHESVFMFDDRQVFCLEWPRDGRPDSALRVVPLDTNLPYEELPRQVLPVNPRSSEVAVDESGVVFTVSSEGAFRTKFRALWLSSDGSLLDTTAERPSMEGPSEARVAWWGKDGSLGIAEGGRMFHLRVTKDALTVEKQDPGVASFDSVPTDAVPSSHLWQPRFILKDARLLLRLDQRSGEVVAGCRLPLVCRGSPIWMADENSPALLTTDQGELVRVIVPQK